MQHAIHATKTRARKNKKNIFVVKETDSHKIMLTLNSHVTSNNEVILTTLRPDDGGWGIYQIKKKAKYKIILPEEERTTPIYCHNAAVVSACLCEFGRDFTVNNVYDNMNPSRGSQRHEAKLKGARIEKI